MMRREEKEEKRGVGEEFMVGVVGRHIKDNKAYLRPLSSGTPLSAHLPISAPHTEMRMKLIGKMALSRIIQSFSDSVSENDFDDGIGKR